MKVKRYSGRANQPKELNLFNPSPEKQKKELVNSNPSFINQLRRKKLNSNDVESIGRNSIGQDSKANKVTSSREHSEGSKYFFKPSSETKI